jgi:NhaA family Na+:H+ antiporter
MPMIHGGDVSADPVHLEQEEAALTAVRNGIRFLLENSLFLVAGTIAALILANAESHQYHAIVHTEVAPHISLHFVVNDVLMCFFFALAAKEIWEALLPGGALSSPRTAATPLIATAGGIIGPAGLYLLGAGLLGAGALARGWAIPCATDIAFSYLVARLIFGRGHPAIPFLLLLAIADDAIGLIILAVVYPTGDMHLLNFFAWVAGAVLFNLVVLRRFLKLQSFWWYLIVAGPLSWWGFFQGGIHPALALVPIIPTLPHAKEDVGYFEGTGEEQPQDALNRFQYWWKTPVELILMLFGFANAGVAFGALGVGTWLVSAGLLVGKPLGIFLFTILACSLFRLELPRGMTWRDLVALGCMAGIGFTVALFVATVAFPAGATLDAAKMGALFSFAAVLVSFVAARALDVGRFGGRRIAEGEARSEPVAV